MHIYIYIYLSPLWCAHFGLTPWKIKSSKIKSIGSKVDPKCFKNKIQNRIGILPRHWKTKSMHSDGRWKIKSLGFKPAVRTCGNWQALSLSLSLSLSTAIWWQADQDNPCLQHVVTIVFVVKISCHNLITQSNIYIYTYI